MAHNRLLYWSPESTAAWRVRIALEEKQLPYESKEISLQLGEHKTPEVLAINPRGKVPTFKDGDAVVNESCAILGYLEMQYPENPLLPSDPKAKAEVWQRIFEVLTTQDVTRIFASNKLFGKEVPNEEEELTKTRNEIALWERYAGKYKYIACDEFTLADAAVGPLVLLMERYGLKLDSYPNLKRYIEAIKERPSVAKTYPQNWTETEQPNKFMEAV